MESILWQEIERCKALKSLVFDSVGESLKQLVCRIDLRSVGSQRVCVIVFSHPFALQEWKREEAKTLEKMRKLYKERDLKGVVVFHNVKAEVSHKPQPLEKEATDEAETYKEQSSGEFEIRTQDEKLKNTFKAIQAAIKDNLAKQRSRDE